MKYISIFESHSAEKSLENQKIAKIFMEFNSVWNDTADYVDDPDIPKYHEKVISIADKIGFDTDYSESEMSEIIRKKLSDSDRKILLASYKKYNDDISKIPSILDVKDLCQPIIDDFNIEPKYYRLYKDSKFMWVIEMDLSEKIVYTIDEEMDEDDSYINTEAYEELLNDINHIKSNLPLYNCKFKYNSSNDVYKLYINAK